MTNDQIETRLREAGIQPTLQRLSICRFVLCEADHPTAEDIHAWSEKNLAMISLATVYNTLNTLVAAGLLRQFRFPVTDKVIYDNNLEPHHHFFDTKSQTILDIPADRVDVEIRLGKQYRVDDTSVFITGEYKNLTPNKQRSS